MLSLSEIKDYLANGADHDSAKESLNYISQNSKDPEVKKAVKNLINAWNNSVRVQYQLDTRLHEAEEYLETFIKNYLKDYL